MDKIATSIICCFNRGTVLTDASRILPETTCQVPLAPHQWRTVDISKIIKNYFNIFNLFYATSFAFCHMAANYCTSLSSQFMYTSESSVPADFCYSSQARTHTHTHAHTHTHTHIKVHYKCTKCARRLWFQHREADARDRTAFCPCQFKMRKSGYPNLIQNKRRYTMKPTNRIPLLQSQSSLYVVKKSYLLCHV